MRNGIDQIAKERSEQIKLHDRTIAKDVLENFNEELREGALALLTNNKDLFPGKWDAELCKKMIGKSYKERLVYAGAFIAAEIDRIQAH